jgi:uncharacterized damage-inducible protein DinB
MQTLEIARDQFAHCAWADAEVWIAVRGFPAAWSDDVVRTKLHHIHIVQYAFPAIWDRRPVEVAPLENFGDSSAMLTWARQGHAELAVRAASTSAAEAATHASVPWSRLLEERIGREAAPVTIGETMLQVAQHSAYHRGQVNARLREIGCKPPFIDYIVWIWLGRPEPRWDLALA